MAKSKTLISDTFTLKGEWWLPATPERKVNGELSFSPDGPCELVLAGTLHDIPKGPWKGFSSPLIFGKTLDGKLCSVMDAHESSFHLHSSGFATTSFFYNQLALGHEFINPTETTFESAVVDLTDFSGWLHRDPFQNDKRSHAASSPSVSISYKMPEIISVHVPTLAASLRFESSINTNIEYQKRTLRHVDFLRVKPRQKQKLEWYLDVIFKFRMLLSLLVGEPVNIISIRLCTRLQKLPSLEPKPYRDYLDLFLRQVGKKRDKELLPPEIPFTYPAIKKDLRLVMNSWYRNADRMRTVYGLHFGVRVNRGIPVEFQFLSLLQALESYHREKGRDKYMSDTRYLPLRDMLVNGIPSNVAPDFRAALKSKIRFGNEYSLRKRLELTIRSVPEAIVDLFTSGDKFFVTRVVATRNYLTHRDESQKQDVMDFKGMFNASESLALLITYLLLSECGLRHELIVSVMQTHHTFKNRARIL